MIRFIEIRALLLSGALIFFSQHDVVAQLRLQDILAPAESDEPLEVDPEPVVEEEIDPFVEFTKALREQPEKAPSLAKAFLENFEPLSPEHETALAETVRTLADHSVWVETISFADSYGDQYPDGSNREAMRAHAVCARLAIGDHEEAGDALQTMAELGQGALLKDAGCLWRACETLMATGNVELIRRLVIPLREQRLTAGEKALADWWLLESLLVSDDTEIQIPTVPVSSAPLRSSLQLRRALVLHRRGKFDAAAAITSELSHQSRSLSPAERHALKSITPGGV